MKTITLGISPCPNDTFIFDALLHGKIDTKGLSFDFVLEDVETLNQWAMAGKLDVTKLSFASFFYVTEKYQMLSSGAALGRGVGPLLIAKRRLDLQHMSHYTVAIPGKYTTAHLLTSLAFPKGLNTREYVFHEIENAVLSGACDAGVIIHENRFTYASKGLVKLLDLGDWWEQKTNAAIPLGGIAIKRSVPKEVVHTLNDLIRESVRYAWNTYPDLAPWVVEHAQEMNEDVMRQHINLYVNRYTEDLGDEGTQAVNTLYEHFLDLGMASGKELDIFAISTPAS